MRVARAKSAAVKPRSAFATAAPAHSFGSFAQPAAMNGMFGSFTPTSTSSNTSGVTTSLAHAAFEATEEALNRVSELRNVIVHGKKIKAGISKTKKAISSPKKGVGMGINSPASTQAFGTNIGEQAMGTNSSSFGVGGRRKTRRSRRSSRRRSY